RLNSTSRKGRPLCKPKRLGQAASAAARECVRPCIMAHMSELKKLPRPRCEHCQRPASHCLCAYISRIPNRTQVLVLQHPDEANHPLNTARLAVMGLLNAQLLVGEHFLQLDDFVASADRVLLLFPEREASSAQVP